MAKLQNYTILGITNSAIMTKLKSWIVQSQNTSQNIEGWIELQAKFGNEICNLTYTFLEKGRHSRVNDAIKIFRRNNLASYTNYSERSEIQLMYET